MSMNFDVDDDTNVSQEQDNNPPADQGGGGGGSNVGGKMVEKGSKELSKKLQKEATKNAHKMALKGALSHIMMYVFAGIVIFIIVVGIIMFLVTMPGMVMEKLKAIFKAVGNYVAAFFGADTTEQIDDTEIFETLDYLEQMGYDIKGEGFLSDYETLESLEKLTEELKEGSYKLDKKTGVIRNTEDDTIAQAQSDFIFTYIMSDNYVYTIKNDNLVTQEPGSGFWSKVVGGFKAARYKIGNFFAGPIYEWLGVKDALTKSWGKGMLVFYKEDGAVGDRGAVKDTGATLWDWDTIKIDTDSKKLSIKRKSLFNNNNAMEFSLDGWTGRYGMPLEFLLSVHKATGMPELAVDMVNSFPTEIEIILHKTSGDAVAAFKNEDGEYITYEKMQTLASEGWSPTDGWTLSKEEAYKILALGIKSPDNCTHTAPTLVLIDSTDNGDWGVFDDDQLKDFEKYGFDTTSEFTDVENFLSGAVCKGTNEEFTASEAMVKKTDESLDGLKEDVAKSYGYNEAEAKITSPTTKINGSSLEAAICDESAHVKKSDVLGEDYNVDQHTEFLENYMECGHTYRKRIGGHTRSTPYYIKKDPAYYQTEKTVITREWLAENKDDPNGGDATYQWVTYVYKVYKYTNEERTEGKTYIESYIIDYVLRELTVQELIDAKVLNEDGTTKDNTRCSDDAIAGTSGVTKCCENCRKYVKKIMSLLKAGDDANFETYAPYISRVSDHWYRDVYFVINDEIEKELDKSFVQYDYDYEALTKERWTLYETYTDNPDDGYKYNEDREGEFILFRIAEDGSYETDEDGNYILFDGEIEDARPSVLYEKNEKGEYVEYTGNYNNTEGKVLYRRNSAFDKGTSKEEYVLYTGTVAVAKKAVELELNEENLKDLGWNKNSSGIWTAYDLEDTTSGFDPLYSEEEIAAEESVQNRDLMENCYINVNLQGNLVQTGEGLRTETNYEIKKMFLQNNYFKYDGSANTAEIITKLRNRVYEERINDSDKTNNQKYGPLTDSERELYITETSSTDADGDGKNDEIKYLVKDYSGKVVLNQDSLNAFSMLENTHTLDADYIYRDFKELIVELGYFEKEELTDETPRLLQFLVPEIGSGGFPRRVLDKRENEKGTMLHSEYDYEANKKYTMQFLLENIDKLTEPPEGAGQEQETIAGIDGKEFRDDILGTVATTSARPMTRFTNIGSIQEIPECNYEVTGATGASGGGVKVADLDVDGVGYEIWRQTDSTCTLYSFAFMATAYTGEPFKDYVTTSSGSFINATGTGQGGNTFWQQGAGVVWSPIQEEIGGEYYFPSEPDIGGKVATALSEGKPVYFYGDYKASAGYHAVVLLGNSDNGVLIYDPGGGNVHVYNSGSSFSSSLQSLLSTHFKHRILIPDEAPEGVKKTGERFTGYKGNEAVVSPVTGILLEYGTYTNDDIDVEAYIKGETEKLNKPEETTDENTTEKTTTEDEKVTKEPDRINVDLKYGPKVSLDMLSDDEETTDGSEDATTENTTTDEVKSDRRIVVDEVGYARILVLDKESYEKLEKNTNTKWKTYDDSDGLLSDKGVYADAIFSEEDLEDQKNKEKEADRSAELMETVYGYKEFAERYEMAGISGYIIQIDGFKPELPDEDFAISDDPTAQTEKPQGTALTMESFKINPSKITEENKNIISLYEPDEDYKMASEKATKKLNVENLIKTNAAPALTADGLVFIKEGTVIGRTYTDREVIEDLRSEQVADYKGETTDSTTTSTTGLDPDNDKLVGNYLRITMTDLDKNIVEDVENYMKLDEETMGDSEDFSILGTVIGRSEWVELAYEYASNHGADSVFTDKDNLGKMYDICVEHGVNPEYIFVRGIQESSLNSPNGNYWGYATPNGEDLADLGSWDTVLTLYCELINEYQDPSTSYYDKIMERYEERKNCTENGGIDPLGYGKPDTIGGQQCLYSWLGDDHSENSAGGGGMYYLYPWGWGGNQYEGENKIIFESKQEFEQLCGSQHDTAGGKISNVATTVWEQGMYTAYQSRMIVDLAKGIFGERAGTYR